MSLDKQRILSELGNVVNQLQNADCGCMGKLFNGGQGGCARMGNPLPTCGGCRRGCCSGHGFGVNYANIPASGEPFSMNSGGMSGGGMNPEGMHGGMDDGMHGGMNEGMHGGMPGGMHGGMPGGMPGGMHGGMPGGMHGGMQGGMHGGMHGGMRGGMHGGMRGGMRRNGIQDGMPMGMGTRNAGMPFGANCMMGRSAPKMYADTYNYLNKNMMQPTMQEVYNELKSITPENTIAANPLATQMGLPAPGGMNQVAGGMGGQMPSGGMQMPGTTANPMTSQNTPHMGGLGANIVNMMMSGGGGRPSNMPKGGQLNEPILIDAPNSPHGQVGVTPIAANGNMGMTGMSPGGAPGQPNDGNMGAMPMMHNPVTQYVTQDNMHEMNSMPPQGNAMPQTAMPSQGMQQGNMLQGNAIQGNAIQQGNPMQQSQVMQQINPMQQGNVVPQGNAITGNTPGVMTNIAQRGHNPYGQHSAGIKKFNEMFPGVMQGDLNFDPMAIALQMNPANQKQVAIDTMTKLMSGNKGQAMMQPVLRGANAAVQQLSGAQGGQQQPLQGQQQTAPGQQIPGATLQPNQPQVYAAHTGAPVMNKQMNQQQITQQQIQGQEDQQGQQQIDPNTGAAIEGTEGTDPNALQESAPATEQGTIDPTINTIAYNMTPQYNNVQYNTLGQPVNLLAGTAFHRPTPGLPQTLDGTYRGDLEQRGVKNTMSKTAIAGTIPLGATASRSQLQHIYRQCRAAQNIKTPLQASSPSTGHLNTANNLRNNAAPPTQQTLMEIDGGDGMANNQGQPKMEQGLKQVDEAQPPARNAPHGDMILEKSHGVLGKGRNGLQDLAFSAYRGKAASWSFHG